MEALTRLVSESLARHGFDRPLDYRRLHWSRWFRCESPHSLLFVPSKPGVFAVAEEIMDFPAHVGADAFVRPAEQSEARSVVAQRDFPGRDFAGSTNPPTPRRMLAVTQFFEDDDMAFVLDRMLSQQNPMRARLISGRYFVRFVVIDDQTQRRTICSALNQWMLSSAEKASGIGSHFASSLELTPTTEYVPQADEAQQNLFDDTGHHDASVERALPSASSGQAMPATARSTDTHAQPPTHVEIHVETPTHVQPPAHVETAASAVPRSEASGAYGELGLSPSTSIPTAPHLDSGAATNIHCPSPLPSGF